MSAPDISEFVRLSRPKRKPCGIGIIVPDLKPADRNALTLALEDTTGRVNTRGIREWFHRRGHTVTDNAIVNHRKGQCSCADES